MSKLSIFAVLFLATPLFADPKIINGANQDVTSNYIADASPTPKVIRKGATPLIEQPAAQPAPSSEDKKGKVIKIREFSEQAPAPALAPVEAPKVESATKSENSSDDALAFSEAKNRQLLSLVMPAYSRNVQPTRITAQYDSNESLASLKKRFVVEKVFPAARGMSMSSNRLATGWTDVNCVEGRGDLVHCSAYIRAIELKLPKLSGRRANNN